MADKERERLIIVNELLETSSSDDEEIENILLSIIKEERPKIKDYMNVVNEYSDKEVYITYYHKYFYGNKKYLFIVISYNIRNISFREISVYNAIHI